MLQFTKIAANGATIEPMRPIIEQVFMIVFRILVGHCSAVYNESVVNAMVIEPLPITKHSSTSHEYSFAINCVATMDIAAKMNAPNSRILRFIRFNRNCANKLPGISMLITTINDIYGLAPAICVDDWLNP